MALPRSQRKTPSQSFPVVRRAYSGLLQMHDLQECERAANLRHAGAVNSLSDSAAATTRSTKYYRENGRGDCTNKVISMHVKSRHRRPNGIADPSNENGYTLTLKMGPLEYIIGRR